MLDLAPVLVRDLDDRIIFWNRGAEMLYGFTRDEAIGKSTDELFNAAYPKPIEEVKADAMRDGEWRGEIQHTRRDGSEIALASHWALHRDEDGNPKALIEVNSDITDRKRAEEALRESEKRLRATFDNAAVGILEVDSSDHLIAANDRVCRMLGYSREELLAMNVQDLTFPDDRQRSRELNAQLHDGRLDTMAYEKRYVRGDGSVVWVQVTVSAIRDTEGRFERAIGIIEDISERRETSEALRESEERFRTLFDTLPVGAVLIDPDTLRFPLSNEFAAANLGFGREEFAQITLPEIEALHDEALIRQNMARFVGGERLEFETRHRTKAGEIREVLVRGQATYSREKPLVLTIWMDITDRKQAEEELAKRAELLEEQARLLDLAHVLIRDPQDRIVSWNAGAEALYGYSREEAIGRVSDELFHTMFPAPKQGLLDALADTGHWEGELIHTAKDGHKVVVASHQVVYKDATGRAVAILEVNNDITEQKRAQDEVTRLNAELERRVIQRTAELEASNKELEAFSYSVSHDLRAPLRAIDGFSNALLKNYLDKLDPKGQDYLQRVRAAAQRMAQLIDDILGLSRAGRVEMHPERVDLSEMARDILDDLGKSQPKRGAEIAVEPGMTVTGDAHLLRIALDNLLGNAWKFTANRAPARIEVGSIEQNGERVYFVRDNGAGFDPKYADKLFSPFQRLHSDAEFAGTGIGLALVQRIIRRHGGRIWTEAAVEEGATFYFTLPEAKQ